MRMRLALAVALFPAAAAATVIHFGNDWVPVELPGAGPLSPTDVQLVEQRVTIAILPDGESFDAETEYTLHNPGPSAAVQLAVPIRWREYRDGRSSERATTAANAVRDVAVMLRGIQLPCVPSPSTWHEEEKFRATSVGGHCEARLRIGHGRQRLVVRERGEVERHDWGNQLSPLYVYERRTLRHRLVSRQRWAGPAPRLVVTLKPGLFEGLVTPQAPGGARLEGGSWHWDLAPADAADVREIRAAFDAEPVLRHDELATYAIRTRAGKPWLAFSAHASHASGSHAAEAAVDADPATAWCAPGVPGEWLEVAWGDAAAGGAHQHRPHMIAVVPGDASNAASWVEHGRLKSFRLAPCGEVGGGAVLSVARDGADPRSGPESPGAMERPGLFTHGRERPVDAALHLSEHFARSAFAVAPPPGAVNCVRLTIVEVVPGKAGDVCVSELRPIYAWW